jgi:thiol-disulfide isomerase/thioredoxin
MKTCTGLSARLLLFTLFISVGTYSQRTANEFTGKWRGEFIIQQKIVVPFNFEVAPNGMVYLINADERFETAKIIIKNDSLFVPMDQFDNELAFRIGNNKLTGELRKQDHTGTPLAVTAEKGKEYRFDDKKIKADNISGTYDVTFNFESGKREKSVAVFKQNGNQLTGTFLKQSGDARYLQGIVEGNKFQLSSFIGSTPGYYRGTVNADGTITGEQLGSKIHHRFSGKKDSTAALPEDGKKLQTSGRKKFTSFTFPDIEGNPVSSSDEKFRNKVLIIPITGTWCPNCVDEALFLGPWYKENKSRGVEIITIHYERQTDTAYARKVMRRFRDRFNIEYDQVFGGYANSDSVRTSLSFPEFKAFPTTILIDKKGNVARVHSGYSGPATGKFYNEFLKEFNEEIDQLLKE